MFTFDWFALVHVIVLVSDAPQEPEPSIFPVDEDSGPIEVRRADGYPQSWFATRLVDSRTGANLQGRISAYVEHEYPEPPTWPPIRSAESDAEGWVRLRIDDLMNANGLWLVAEAPGYAPASEMTAIPPLPWELELAVDVPLEVRDALGRPVAGARVGWLLGCGHTIDVRQVITDAHGQATLSGVLGDKGELWVHGSQLLGNYADLAAWRSGRSRLVIHRDPAPTWIGVVVDSEGKPRSGVHVGSAEYHRGPWALTDAQGCFVLEGLADDAVTVVDQRNGEEHWLELPPHGFEARLVLPRPGEERTNSRRPDHSNLYLDLDARGGTDGEPIPVVAWCAELHFVEHQEVGLEALRLGPDFSTNLPAGRYALRVGGGESAWKERRIELDVPGEGSVEHRIALEPRARVKLWLDTQSAFARLLAAGGEVQLVTATWMRSIEEELRGGRSIAVPEDTPWAVRLRVFDRVHHVPSALVDARGELELAPIEPHRARVRFADAQGRPRLGRARLAKHSQGRLGYKGESPWSAQAESVELTTWLGAGRWLLLVESADPAWRAPVVLREVDLPETAREPVDLGTITFVPAHERGLVLRHPDGDPVDRLVVTMNGEPEQLDAFGRLREGSYVGPLDRLEADLGDGITAPLVAVLEGAGPWDLRWPAGAIELDVRDSTGTPISEFALHLDGAVHRGCDGRLVRRGLSIGPREGIVAARGFVPQRVKLDLAPSAKATLRLQPR